MKRNFILLLSIFCLGFLVLIIFSFLFFNRLNTSIEYSDSIYQTHNTIYYLMRLKNNVLACENWHKSFLLTKDPAWLDSFKIQSNKIQPLYDSIRQTLKNSK